jgi:hypothetical protein
MSEPTPERDDIPELPEELDGLPDKEPLDSPPAAEDPANPDAHGPLFHA